MTDKSTDEGTRVVITGFEIPFWELAGAIIKLTLATIPAAVLLWALWYAFAVLGP